MNKRRKAYKECRPLRYVDANGFWADDVIYQITPRSEQRRKLNAFKRKHGIPQSKALLIVWNEGENVHKPLAKERKHIDYAVMRGN